MMERAQALYVGPHHLLALRADLSARGRAVGFGWHQIAGQGALMPSPWALNLRPKVWRLSALLRALNPSTS